MEQYTGIVWKIISLHLNNPEDIRECVNETFAGFYFHRDKYDPGRASLPVYLLYRKFRFWDKGEK